MGFQSNFTAGTAVTISGTVATGISEPASTQTIVQKANTKSGTSITAGTGALLYTVTAAKTLYITTLVISSGAINQQWDIRDSVTITGTPIFATATEGTGNNHQTITFETPLKFTAGVFLDISVTGNIFWTFNGYEVTT